MNEARWYQLRFGNGPDMIVRDDTGDDPTTWPRQGRRRFSAVGILLPKTKSEHNKALDGYQLLVVEDGGWLNLGHLEQHPLPVQPLPEEHHGVRMLREAESGIVTASDADVAVVARGRGLELAR